MNQIEKIESRSIMGSRLFELMRNPTNQNFFPFYYFTNFEVKKDDQIYCDYCGEKLDGNGCYATAFFVWENSKTIKICCNTRKHFKGAIWDYHHQIIGQPKHIQLPTDSTPEMRLVFHWAFGSGRTSNGYKIMKFNNLNSWNEFETIKDTNYSGGSYNEDGAQHYQWVSNKLMSYKYTNDGTEIVLQLSQSQILQLVNEILFAMRCYQLKLF